MAMRKLIKKQMAKEQQLLMRLMREEVISGKFCFVKGITTIIIMVGITFVSCNNISNRSAVSNKDDTFEKYLFNLSTSDSNLVGEKDSFAIQNWPVGKYSGAQIDSFYISKKTEHEDSCDCQKWKLPDTLEITAIFNKMEPISTESCYLVYRSYPCDLKGTIKNGEATYIFYLNPGGYATLIPLSENRTENRQGEFCLAAEKRKELFRFFLSTMELPISANDSL